MTTQDIARLIPSLQATALVAENIKKAKKKDKDVEDMLELGATNIVGTSLIRVQSDLVAGL